MNTPAAAQGCAGCNKPIQGKQHRIGIQPDGQPETVMVFCDICARQIARSAVQLDREQSQGVLRA